jgi:hypothetical protein
MKRRCLDPNYAPYPHYGGKGVMICRQWLHDFTAFLRHVGPKPSTRHTLDRIDNAKGYEPGNVRWATKAEQSRNSSNSKLTSIDVKFIRHWRARGYTYASIAKAFGIAANTARVVNLGVKWAE